MLTSFAVAPMGSRNNDFGVYATERVGGRGGGVRASGFPCLPARRAVSCVLMVFPEFFDHNATLASEGRLVGGGAYVPPLHAAVFLFGRMA